MADRDMRASVHAPDVTSAEYAQHRAAMKRYVGDMLAIETHMEERMDGRLRQSLQHPAAAEAVRRFHNIIKGQRESLRAHLTLLGEGEHPPLEDAVSRLLGTAAGALDQVRLESVAEVLRDDYVAFNRAAIGYAMLHAAAHALDHMETMEIADRHLRFYAGAVQEINQLVPDVVVWELEKAGMAVNREAIEHCTAAINRAWRDTAPSEMPAPNQTPEGRTIRRAA